MSGAAKVARSATALFTSAVESAAANTSFNCVRQGVHRRFARQAKPDGTAAPRPAPSNATQVYIGRAYGYRTCALLINLSCLVSRRPAGDSRIVLTTREKYGMYGSSVSGQFPLHTACREASVSTAASWALLAAVES
eukprot:scaffold205823_cov36-Tisochrysis_lutea.AAC.2